MPAPLIAAGARAAGRRVAKRKSTSRRGVRGAAVTNRSNRAFNERAHHIDERYQTIDSKTRNANASYSSVENTRDIRKQNRATQKQKVDGTETYSSTKMYARKNQAIRQKQRFALRQNKTGTADGLLDKATTRLIDWSFYVFFMTITLYGWSLEILGMVIASGFAASTDWIPLIGGTLSQGSIAVGFFVFCLGWVVAGSMQALLSLYLIRKNRPDVGSICIALALACTPLVHILPYGFVLLSQRKKSTQ